MQQIVIASGNKGKLAEFSHLFETFNIDVRAQSEFDITDAEETGTTFVENAIIKAKHASEQSGLPAIADDSGLVVPSLNGEPGIYSARYAGEHGNDSANNQKLLAELKGEQNRSAMFLCVLVYMRHAKDPNPVICEGKWHGSICENPSGSQGFGYDPVFYVASHNCTAAELDKQQKGELSHRGIALNKLMRELAEQKIL